MSATLPSRVLSLLAAAWLSGCAAGTVRFADADAVPADVAWSEGRSEARADSTEAEPDATDVDPGPEPVEAAPDEPDPPAPSDAEGGEEGGSEVEAGDAEATPDTPDAAAEADVPPAGCVPDGDGVITAAETPVALGAVVSYRVSAAGQTVGVPDLAGAPCGAGLCWDFSAPLAGDTTEADAVRPVQQFWFADRFPADAVVVPIDARTGNLAVYQKTDAAFLMLGLASEQEGVTALVYDPPVTILAFPFQKGSTWQTEEARADGLFEGALYPDAFGNHVVHAYRFTVNGRGQLTVPAGTFPVLRLLLDLTMEARNAWGVPYEIPGLAETTHVKVYDFLAECVGLVARVRSTEGELATFFNDATEYKRLGF